MCPRTCRHIAHRMMNGRLLNFACMSQVGLFQTAHSWANARVLLGARVRRRVALMKLVREEK